MASTSTTPTFKDLSQKALSANKDHQYALRVYTERLEAELETVDKLLASVELPGDELDIDVGGSIIIPGAAKAISPIPSELSFEESPFAEDVARRRRYLKATVIHPMKTQELEALADAVHAENHRLLALDAQRRGQQPFVGLDEYPAGFLEANKAGLNWDRIASKVSAAGVTYVQRTAEECEIRWLGDRHPEFDHSSWSKAEIDKVKELVGDAKEGEVDWVEIAAKLGTKRTPLECMRNAIPRKTHVWTSEADQRLLDAVGIYGTEAWPLVARQVSEDATAVQCQSRYLRSLDPAIRRGLWTAEEDAQLKQAVEVFGRSWTEVCMWVPGRSNEQCRERYQEVVNPPAKGKWSEEEDRLLLDGIKQCGEGKWKAISQIVGRSDNTCRSRYTLLMKRKAKSDAESRDASTEAALAASEQRPIAGPSKRRGPPPAQRDTEAEPAMIPDETPPTNTTTDQLTEGSVKSKSKPRPRQKRKGTDDDSSSRNLAAREVSEEKHVASPSAKPNPPLKKARPIRRREADQIVEPVDLSASQAPDGDLLPELSQLGRHTDTLQAVPIPPPPKRGRGRPRKYPKPDDSTAQDKPPEAKRRRVAKDTQIVEAGDEPAAQEDRSVAQIAQANSELVDGTLPETDAHSVAQQASSLADVGAKGHDAPNDGQAQDSASATPRRGRGRPRGGSGQPQEPLRRSARRQVQA